MSDIAFIQLSADFINTAMLPFDEHTFTSTSARKRIHLPAFIRASGEENAKREGPSCVAGSH
ncbi:hypothetical protein K443DRAFT_641526 [Laccaria amethystina LaAM-08-1]|uniref:Uncharacterized protein n=1 Tax=Laccaria amethystina LaAM-08-1 TaxID=1095629 RepID=A0A0C9WSB9_9AGAR|nr:hypothetical protein K443DRAFT_641526 [Laccaria amethystina LaAM-08-1]